VRPISQRFLVQSTRCLEEGKTCKSGEVLAIFNTLAKNGEFRTNPEFVRRELQSRIRELPRNSSQVNFSSATVTVYSLPATANLSADKTQVCGNFLFRIKFTGSVNEAISALNAWTTSGTDPLFDTSTLYGIQPDGISKPGDVLTSGDDIPSSRWHGTEIIGSFGLAPQTRDLPLVKVAVLDTGWLDAAIPSIEATVKVDLAVARNLIDLEKISFTVLDDVDISEAGQKLYPGVGHGTPVASIIGGQDPTMSVAPNADIVPIKVCDSKGDCEEASVIYGTCYAASEPVKASVINMSFAARVDPTAVPRILQTAINDVTMAGSLVVVAGGNSRSDSYLKTPGTNSNDLLYPAMVSSGFAAKLAGTSPVGAGGMFLAVGSVFTKGDYAGFATTAPFVDLSAPGSWLKVLGKDGKIHQSPDENISGTSFSAAYISGVAALGFGKHSPITPTRLARHLINTANTANCNKVTMPKPDTDCGAGMVDVPHVLQVTPLP
jgi:hypothetical protein